MNATVTLPNIKKYTPFVVDIEDINNTHQVDIVGTGVLNYFDKIDNELLTEIKANIDFEIVKYLEDLPVDPSTIGYHFNIKPKKKIDREYNAEIVDLNVSIFIEKVENGNDTAQLALIKIITLIILGQIMVLP